jgi:16S rRNA (cytosine1407-C5)-methyltransferase
MSRRKRTPRPLEPAKTAQRSALERFLPLLAPDEVQQLTAELERPLPLALRTNPLKARNGAEQEWAKRYGWQLAPVEYCPTGWKLVEMREPAAMTLEHRMGHYYIQDAASMLPVELFDLDEHSQPLVLDLAASPGGKTTHLSARLRDRGLVIANDSSQERITALRLVLQTWGAANTAVTRFPGEKFGRWYPETFDRILLDAPCSMQSLRSSESHPMRPISEREQSSLARRQVGLLSAAIAALKPGGQVVYSTCTLAAEEDEAVIDEVLKLFSGAVEVADIRRKLPAPAPGLREAYGRSFNPQVERAARLWPHRYHTSGFFAALLTKNAAIDAPQEPPPDRPLSLVGQYPLNSIENRDVHHFFLDEYGTDLAWIEREYRLELWRNPAGIFLLPQSYLERFSGLPCQLLGMKLADYTPAGLVPAHDWTARFGPEVKAGRVALEENQVAAWLRGEDAGFSTASLKPDSTVIVFDPDERCLGRARVQPGRLKNLLPRRLV